MIILYTNAVCLLYVKCHIYSAISTVYSDIFCNYDGFSTMYANAVKSRSVIVLIESIYQLQKQSKDTALNVGACNVSRRIKVDANELSLQTTLRVNFNSYLICDPLPRMPHIALHRVRLSDRPSICASVCPSHAYDLLEIVKTYELQIWWRHNHGHE